MYMTEKDCPVSLICGGVVYQSVTRLSIGEMKYCDSN